MSVETTEEFVDKLKEGSDKLKMGYFLKDTPKGKMIDDWTSW